MPLHLWRVGDSSLGKTTVRNKVVDFKGREAHAVFDGTSRLTAQGPTSYSIINTYYPVSLGQALLDTRLA